MSLTGDPRTPADMRTLADAKQADAETFHARADNCGKRLIALLIAQPGSSPCGTCGHVATDADRDRLVAELRAGQRRWAGLGNASGTLAMFWRGCADRAELAMQEAAQ